jgi:phasin
MIDPKLTMEVPAQVREFAVKSVDQAEKAISTFMESASKSFAMAPAPMSDVAKQALTITEANIKASFDHARKLMEAKDIGEVLRLQTEFVRSQFGTVTEQFQEMTSSAAAPREREKPDSI